MLFILSGLPGTGKTTIARAFARRANATYLRVDTIEQALRDLCDWNVQGEGYRLAYRVARDNVQLGLSVVVDSCNPIELTRREWEEVAVSCNVDFVNIEVICSDSAEHRGRIEQRTADIAGLVVPTWAEVTTRTYDAWERPRIQIDTAGCTVNDCIEKHLHQFLR